MSGMLVELVRPLLSSLGVSGLSADVPCLNLLLSLTLSFFLGNKRRKRDFYTKIKNKQNIEMYNV